MVVGVMRVLLVFDFVVSALVDFLLQSEVRQAFVGCVLVV